MTPGHSDRPSTSQPVRPSLDERACALSAKYTYSPAPEKVPRCRDIYRYVDASLHTHGARRPLLHPPMKEPSGSALDELPLLADSKGTLPRRSPTGARVCPERRSIVVPALFALITLTFIYYTHASPPDSRRDIGGDKEVPSLGVPRSVQQSWVMYSPFYAVEPYVPPPRGCSVDQVRLAFFLFLRVTQGGRHFVGTFFPY